MLLMVLHRFAFLIILLLMLLATKAASQVRQPDCQRNCGSVAIPYPFGTTPSCYYDESFLITCNNSFTPPKPFLRHGTIEVLDISEDGQMQVLGSTARSCYNNTNIIQNISVSFNFTLSKFYVSYTRNKFISIGCATVGLIGSSNNYSSGCISRCNSPKNTVNGSCSGTGCCQYSIPEGIKDFQVTVGRLLINGSTLKGIQCGYGFVVEETAYSFSSLDLQNIQNISERPLVLDWAIGNETCQDALRNSSSYACKSANSECRNAANGSGYHCRCSDGFRGNPYLNNGCQDIDECSTEQPCTNSCLDLSGSFRCSCPDGYEGDGLKNGTGCARDDGPRKLSLLLSIFLGVCASLLTIVAGGSWIYWGLKKRKLMRVREKFFQQNGGLLLQLKLSNHRGTSVEAARIFTSQELKEATNNYDESRVIGQGGYGTVYKGLLPDNKVVAIKKSKTGNRISQTEQFINEVVVLSQINHRNVVKLLGCCLETEVPLLVYEFITNGTLSEHVHGKVRGLSLSWEKRLKIAAEAAGALSYMHSATSMPIIHRDVKTTNILLDDSYSAKVSDFGTSRLIPLDQAQVTTLVQGTLGYLDPEYFFTSQLTEKSDVYSFGVVLVELLTGMEVLSFDRPESDRNLAMYFVSSMKDGLLDEILDAIIVDDTNLNQVKEVAKLARRCLRVKGEERPTMKEVEMELEELRSMSKHPWGKGELYSEETDSLLRTVGAPSDLYSVDIDGDIGCSSSRDAGYDSMRSQILKPMGDGR